MRTEMVDLREHARSDEERERVITVALEYFESVAARLASQMGRSSIVVTEAMSISGVRERLMGAVKDGISDQDLARALVDTACIILRESVRGGA